jgi:hypothetical protein
MKKMPKRIVTICCYGGEYHVVQVEPRQVISSHDSLSDAQHSLAHQNFKNKEKNNGRAS